MASSLIDRRCVPCEGGVPTLSSEEVGALLTELVDWKLSDDGKSIHRKLVLKNFAQAISYLNRIGELAEAEQHHPDLHLTGYRNVRVELTTHAIDGLSENDFILAAKIDSQITQR